MKPGIGAIEQPRNVPGTGFARIPVGGVSTFRIYSFAGGGVLTNVPKLIE